MKLTELKKKALAQYLKIENLADIKGWLHSAKVFQTRDTTKKWWVLNDTEKEMAFDPTNKKHFSYYLKNLYNKRHKEKVEIVEGVTFYIYESI